MSRGENSVSIPIDLINEIFSRLPGKSVARFSCLSKQWRDTLDRPYFKELFFTRSSAQPRLLFSVKRDGCEDVCLFSSPLPNDLYNKSSSLVVTADFQMNLPKRIWTRYVKHAFGFVYSCESRRMVICNPSTGQFAPLPEEGMASWSNNLLFDPVDKQFKVLSIQFHNPSLMLILGTGDYSWREIYCPFNDLFTCYLHEGICINGVLYYFATQSRSYLIVFFDVRSEGFKFIYKDFISGRDSTKMINYKGKLGVITLKYDYNPWDWDPKNSNGRKCSLKLCMSVLREDPNSEWSEHVYTFRKTNQCVGCRNFSTILENQIVAGDVSVVGVTARGDIVLCMEDVSKPLCVFYFNIERNTLQRVEFRTANNEAFERRSSKVKILSVDHVEDLNFINMKTS